MNKNYQVGRWLRSLSVLLGSGILLLAVLALLAAARPALAQGPAPGEGCVQQFVPNAGCTANDVRIEEIRYITITNYCSEEPLGTMTATLEVLISADGSPDRYDIGMFIALAGNTSALTGTYCFHDFLSPPVTTTPSYTDTPLLPDFPDGDGIPDIYNGPWWDGEGDPDTCGDIEANTQVFRVTQPVMLSCRDLDSNGFADVSVCTSWDNNKTPTCDSVQGAIPGTGSKCSCDIVNLRLTPSAVEMGRVAISPDRGSVSIPLAALILLGLGTIAGLRNRRAKRN
jgi:hypothetical protein